MTVLVLGATGATGRLVVNELLKREQKVRIVVRSTRSLSLDLLNNRKVEITYANILELSENELLHLVTGCDAVVSCLGHNLTLKGMFGEPRRLVTNTIERVTHAIIKARPSSPIKLVLMSSTGVQNRTVHEKASITHKAVITFLRLVLPPHLDNEKAVAFLQHNVEEQSPFIQWVAVRPDSLTNQIDVAPYDLHSSPTNDPIFDAKKTSRINVAHFMAELITSPQLWSHWQSKLPVIYDSAQMVSVKV
ncbi:SDR family oxidoreductase [Vibrio lamellibrachiae]|uniref:NAD(P)-dependent oxidoreductase n=1 Tax=Vibrio lamellibrachiae TaxID=2910253 RepID=UPI003D11F84F